VVEHGGGSFRHARRRRGPRLSPRSLFAADDHAHISKNELKHWQQKMWCIPPKCDAEFVCAKKIALVMDNLNPHGMCCLYEAFTPAAAPRNIEKFEGSILQNTSDLSRQTLDLISCVSVALATIIVIS
jgi:hypothetical protein